MEPLFNSSWIFACAECPPLLLKAIMEQILIQNVQAYAQEHQLTVAERLGFGIHGIIFATDSTPEKDLIATAI